MDTSKTLAALSAQGLARVTPDLAKLLQPSIRITSRTSDESALQIGASKLGGLPDLPVSMSWPEGKGAPLAFIAQIRLEELQGREAARALPPAGLLSFFYDASQQTFGADPADRGGWRVLYSADNLPSLVRRDFPSQLPATARYQPCTVDFSDELTLPQQPELELPTLDWTQAERTQYEQVLSRFPSPEDRAAIHNRMFGHPDTLQDDMRLECQLAAHGVSSIDDPRAAALKAGAMNWRLLLQVDSDEHAGMRWASSGILYFWIEDSALQAHRFDDVWVVLQSE